MNPTIGKMRRTCWIKTLTMLICCLILTGCTMKPTVLMTIEGLDTPVTPGQIIDTASGETISFNQLIEALGTARVIYVGEQHTSVKHHRQQLDVIQALVEKGRHISVGMEMFDHTYQGQLDRWSAGELQWEDFLKQVHWYANWKFDDTLYKEILLYIKSRSLPLVGLNIPFHLPAKIAVGGIETLSTQERELLPDRVDLSNAEHRAYVETVFGMHNLKGRKNFDNFYAAQCAWEDGMAQAIADNLKQRVMVVIAGNGHIVRKFGIPDRAYSRTNAPFRTIYMATPHSQATLADADYIWVSDADAKNTGRMRMGRH
jgi:uncharacterized iron-regulated protein